MVSAAEICAATLQENWHVLVIHTNNTFGKGMIHNVQLLNVSGVAVTKARCGTIQKQYQTSGCQGLILFQG